MDGACSLASSKEVIYGSSGEELPGVMLPTSNVVQTMASTIYGELEKMISNYGDDIVASLMPQIVAVLEYWDKTIRERNVIQLELDITREDAAQLLKQYEKERQLRRSSEQTFLETQDVIEEQRKELVLKVEALEKSCKLLEIKSKSHQDHAMRLEEKESELRKDQDKLHSRYTELLKIYMDLMDRPKASPFLEKADVRSVAMDDCAKGRVGVALPISNDLGSQGQNSQGLFAEVGGRSVGPARLRSSRPCSDSGPVNDSFNLLDAARNALDVGCEPESALTSLPAVASMLDTPAAAAGGDLVVQQLSFEVAPFDELEPEMVCEGDDSSELTDSPSESQSEELEMKYNYGMTREVENLIRENQELIEMKNALNVVKDDLIGQLEQKTAESELLHADLSASRSHEKRLLEEMKNLRKVNARRPDYEEDQDVPPAEQKRFTRVEMARVILERNQYKEKLMELQEAVRWTEMVRATATVTTLGAVTPPQKKKSGIWSFFSGLFTGPVHREGMAHESSSYAFEKPASACEMPNINYECGKAITSSLLTDVRASVENSETARLRGGGIVVGGTDEPTRMPLVDAHGWNGPDIAALLPLQCSGVEPKELLYSAAFPVHCGPLITDAGNADQSAYTQAWCAAAVSQISPTNGIEKILQHVTAGEKSRDSFDLRKSQVKTSLRIQNEDRSVREAEGATHAHTKHQGEPPALIWFSTTAKGSSKILVMDCQQPTECPLSFEIRDQHVLVISCVPELIPSSDTRLGLPGKILERSPELTSRNTDAADGSCCTGDRLYPPTMWLAAQSGLLYVYSATAPPTKPILVGAVDLGDCALCMTYSDNKVFAGLADGTVAVFRRSADDYWSVEWRDILQLDAERAAILCTTAVFGSSIWFGCGAYIYVVDSDVLRIRTKIKLVPRRRDRQVRFMCYSQGGVWVSLRLDNRLRLYDCRTYESLQEFALQPLLASSGLSRMSLLHALVTALELSCGRLWIGMGNGVIISIPLTLGEGAPHSSETEHPAVTNLADVEHEVSGEDVRLSQLSEGCSIRNRYRLPYCNHDLAQFSHHGHLNAVKFIVTTEANDSNYIVSGGDGYVDFRFGYKKNVESAFDNALSPAADEVARCHLIVWHMARVEILLRHNSPMDIPI